MLKDGWIVVVVAGGRLRGWRRLVSLLVVAAMAAGGMIAALPAFALNPSTEIQAAWQEPVTSLEVGEHANAVIDVNSNLPEGQDGEQAPGSRTIQVTTQGAWINELPSICDQGEVSDDHSSLTCTWASTGSIGTSSQLVVPVTASGASDTLTLTASDEDGDKASPAPIKVVRHDRVNVALGNMRLDSGATTLFIDTGVWISAGGAGPEPGSPVEYDITLTDRLSNITAHLTDQISVADEVEANARLFDPVQGQKVTVTREGRVLHVRVTSTPDWGQKTFSNGADAGGAGAFASARISIKLTPGLARPAEVGAALTSLRYTSAATGQVVTADYVDSDNTAASTVYGDGPMNSHIAQQVFRKETMSEQKENGILTGEWNTDESLWAAPATAGPWSATSRVLPGGINLQWIQVNLAPSAGPLTFCYIIPSGQGAHYTGAVGMSWGFAPRPKVEFRSGSIGIADFDVCWGGSGWSESIPADTSNLTAIRISGFSQTAGSSKDSHVAGALIKVDEDTPAGRWINTNGAVRLGDGRVLTIPVTRDGRTGRPTWAPNGSVDAFKVSAARAYTTLTSSMSTMMTGEETVLSGSWVPMGTGGGGAPVSSTLTMRLPAGLDYVAGSASIGEPAVSDGGRTLTWKTSQQVNENKTFSLKAKATTQVDQMKASFTMALPSNLADGGLGSHTSTVAISMVGKNEAVLTKTATSPKFAIEGNTGTNSWDLELVNVSSKAAMMDVIDVLPYDGDKRNTSFDGKVALTALTPAAGTSVYTTTSKPASLSSDPAAKENGKPGAPSGLWQQWDGQESSLKDVTAVRFVSQAVPARGRVHHTLTYTATNVSTGQHLVNSAVARSTSTGLKMVESADTTTAGDPSKLQVSKRPSRAGQALASGRQVEYDITVTASKTGNGDSGVVVTDKGGRGISKVSLSAPSVGSVEGNIWKVGRLRAGQTETVHATATIADDYDGKGVVNQVVVKGDHNEEHPGCQPNSGGVDTDTDQCDEVSVEENSMLRVDKELTPSEQPLAPGKKVTFKVTVGADKTPGATTAADVRVSDLGGKALKDVTLSAPSAGSISTDGVWLVGDMEPGQVETATVTATVSDAYDASGITNTVIVSNPAHPRTAESASACQENQELGADTDQCDVVRLRENSLLRVDKTPTPADQALAPGRTVTYKVTVASDNTPGATTAADVVVKDLRGKNLTKATFSNPSKGQISADGVWHVGDMAPGETQTVTVTGTVAEAFDGTDVINRVITSNPAHPKSDKDTCQVNTGDVTTDNDQCDEAVLRENSHIRVDKTPTPTDQALAPGRTVTYKVTVGADKFKDATQAADVTVTDLGGTSLTKATFTDPSKGQISADGVWHVGDMAPGETQTVTVTGTVAEGFKGGPVTNKVITSNPTHPRTPDSASDCESNTGDVHTDGDQCDLVELKEDATLTINKTPTPSDQPLAAGRTITYTVEVGATGKTIAADVTMADLGGKNLTNIHLTDPSRGNVDDDGIWHLGDMNPGDTATITVTGSVADNFDGTEVHNTAIVYNPSHPRDPKEALQECQVNNDLPGDEDQCDHIVQAEDTALKVDKQRDSDGPAKPGDTITWTITALNAGTTIAADVTVHDLGGTNLEQVTSTNPSKGEVDKDGIWHVGDMAPGETQTLIVTATVKNWGPSENRVIVANPTHPRTTASATQCQTNSGDVTTDTDQCDLDPVTAATPPTLAKTGTAIAGTLGAAGLLFSAGILLIARRKRA